MKPYYQDKWVTIYHGDCREILPTLEPVDLVLTDIPFNVGKDYGTANDNLPLPEYVQFIDDVFTLIRLSDLSSALIKVPTKYLMHLKFGTLLYKWAIGLYVPNSMKPFANGFNQLGLVLWYYKQQALKPTFANDVYMHNRDGEMRASGQIHPNPMDDNFVLRLIAGYSTTESVILDPFLGSGTTCYCAKKLNRKSIGIEIEEKYCEIAAKRCSQEVMELNL